MADFEIAVSKTLAHEGDYVNDSDDPGGETRFGISKRSYPNEDIANLTGWRARQIYRQDFWVPLYASIASQGVADKLFDFGVNAGKRTAIEKLQQALNGLRKGKILIDGVFGPATLAAVNELFPDMLLAEFRAQIAVHYAQIAMRRPASAKYLLGWMRRVMA